MSELRDGPPQLCKGLPESYTSLASISFGLAIVIAVAAALPYMEHWLCAANEIAQMLLSTFMCCWTLSCNDWSCIADHEGPIART